MHLEPAHQALAHAQATPTGPQLARDRALKQARNEIRGHLAKQKWKKNLSKIIKNDQK